MNRSINSIKNILTGISNKILLMVMAFVVRTSFIKMLGAEYNGINSLFLNLITILSLAELGIGNVLMFSLYSSLKNNDEKKICALTYEFKKIYRIVIMAVLALGIVIMLFLPYIVNSDISLNKIYLYYLIYLINSVSTYFVIYRTTVISADQKNYIINITTTITTLIMYLLQIISLYIFKSYLVFLIIQFVCNVCNNLILNYISIKKYPFLKQIDKPEDSSLVDKKDLFKNIKATFIYKLSDTILDQTDSIIISIMFGTIIVGYYSNYFMIVTYLVNIAAIIASGLIASFGNLNAENNAKKSYRMFNASMLLFLIFGILCSTCYVCSVQDFISVWIGKKYLMNYGFILALIFVFYLRMVTNSMWMYRTTMGLFKEVQYISIVAAILNIVLSIILGYCIGVAGVIIATAISRILTTFWYEGKVLYNKFNKDVSEYFFKQLKGLIICFISIVICYSICHFIVQDCNGHYIISFVIKNIICFFVTLSILYFSYRKTNEFEDIIIRIKNIFLIKYYKKRG